jgi:hypothetical protein
MSTDIFPRWTILITGIIIGQSIHATNVLQSFLQPFQDLVNNLLVPVYSLLVVVYIVLLIKTDLSRPKVDKSKSKSSYDHELEIPPNEDENGFVNLSGTYKLISNENFEAFLEAQGVPWALRSAANQARPIHKITHVGKSVKIQIKGIIESETTYEIDGPPIQTKIQSRVFEDTMRYLESGDGIEVTKRAVVEKYTIFVTRRLSKDRQTITLTSRVIYDEGKNPIESVQIFRRME